MNCRIFASHPTPLIVASLATGVLGCLCLDRGAAIAVVRIYSMLPKAYKIGMRAILILTAQTFAGGVVPEQGTLYAPAIWTIQFRGRMETAGIYVAISIKKVADTLLRMLSRQISPSRESKTLRR